MADVLKFEPQTVGDEYRFDPDAVLEAAKGQGFETLAVIGTKPDGTLWVSGNANSGETLVLMEQAKHLIVFGD